MGQRYLFECEECKTRFYLGGNSVDLRYKVPFKSKDGRSIFMTYYDCPKCRKRHYVQIDDAYSIKIKKETSDMFKKLSKKRLNFRSIAKDKNEKFKKLNNKLNKYRFDLKKEFEGQVIISESGLEVEVHFSM